MLKLNTLFRSKYDKNWTYTLLSVDESKNIAIVVTHYSENFQPKQKWHLPHLKEAFKDGSYFYK